MFLLSLKAGGTGLNLTAANHVIHVDRWWNPAVEDQATDRAFRIGQRRDVQVRKFVCVGTVEERIDQMIEDKKALAAGDRRHRRELAHRVVGRRPAPGHRALAGGGVANDGLAPSELYPPSRPRKAVGGIKARSKRGSIGEQWWSRRFIDVLESFGLAKPAEPGSQLRPVRARCSASTSAPGT